MSWSPEQYHQFKRERAAPFEDALALVARREGLHVVDLGCGTGELTRRLADALPESDVVGHDTSAEMLARATDHARPGLCFQAGAIESIALSNHHWDLIFAHASLQWCDNHAALVPQLMRRLRPGGQVVVQVPSNHGEPSHTELYAVASEAPFCGALKGWSRPSPVLSIVEYAAILHAAGARDAIVFEKVYGHVLKDADAIVEWTRGTALVPYLERLPVDLHSAFLARYGERLRRRYPSNPVFFPFRRTFFSARRADEELHGQVQG